MADAHADPMERALSRSRIAVVAAVVLLIVGVHVALGGLLTASGVPLHWIIGGLLALVLIHFVFLHRHQAKRRKHGRGPVRVHPDA
jgi:uncharacterized membrane protein AbrB (regulator of aidB expression)